MASEVLDDKITANNFKSVMKAVRKRRGMVMEDLAFLTGYAKQYLYNLEAGKHVPSLLAAELILGTFGYELYIRKKEE